VRSARATTLLPEHPVQGASRRTIAQSKLSDSCADRSSWVCSVWSCRQFVISRPGIQPSFTSTIDTELEDPDASSWDENVLVKQINNKIDK
jgi:hypothetical protein